jgi:hypothetical protein
MSIKKIFIIQFLYLEHIDIYKSGYSDSLLYSMHLSSVDGILLNKIV